MIASFKNKPLEFTRHLLQQLPTAQRDGAKTNVRVPFLDSPEIAHNGRRFGAMNESGERNTRKTTKNHLGSRKMVGANPTFGTRLRQSCRVPYGTSSWIRRCECQERHHTDNNHPPFQSIQQSPFFPDHTGGLASHHVFEAAS